MVSIKNARIQSESFGARTQTVDTLVLHYTALELAPSLRVLRYRGVSAHYVLAQDGTAYKILENNEVAWHAGLSMWRNKKGVNARSIGVEIVNLEGNKFDYPESQIKALVALCQKIISENPGIKATNVVAHSDIAPKRKVDPGKKFPWRALAAGGVGIWPDGAVNEPVASMDEVQSLLEICGYPCQHAYGLKGESPVYVADPNSLQPGVSRVVRVTPQDILRAFQLRYQPYTANGIPNQATMGLLRKLAALQ